MSGKVGQGVCFSCPDRRGFRGCLFALGVQGYRKRWLWDHHDEVSCTASGAPCHPISGKQMWRTIRA
jgi:hypothetical protein